MNEFVTKLIVNVVILNKLKENVSKLPLLDLYVSIFCWTKMLAIYFWMKMSLIFILDQNVNRFSLDK